ncbi:hypothetical protein [Streptacidiphilus albus]|uniref:hypothetical protein n=1 Tax=Streptacidiphilus albus TaxID=105425 RepID=UPI00054B1276|nr:hypothetical protein [Streptacidiphilus albus]
MNETLQVEPVAPGRATDVAVEITRVVAVAAVLVAVLLVHRQFDATTGALVGAGFGLLGPQHRPGVG